jgi:hypothetical protein
MFSSSVQLAPTAIDSVSLDLAILGENLDVMHFATALDAGFCTDNLAIGSLAN